MEIIKLDPRQIHKASEVLAASFFDYPMFTFYFPDTQRRTRNLPWYFKNILNTALRFGEVYTTPEISGVVFTLPPGHTKISTWEYIQCGFLLSVFKLGYHNYMQSMACEDFVGAKQIALMKNRPHYYLWGLGVDPRKKVQGIGAALMQPVLVQAEAQKMPVYLETHDEKNVRYYQKHGFALIHTACIPKYHLPIWCMLREPA